MKITLTIHFNRYIYQKQKADKQKGRGEGRERGGREGVVGEETFTDILTDRKVERQRERNG